MRKSIHERRGITFAEYGALLGTRAMLASGELKQTERSHAPNNNHYFNMDIAGTQQDCGTVSCIGGTMAFIMGKHPTTYVKGCSEDNRSGALECLFYPPPELDWSWITPQIAVQAIDNWLKTGHPKWSKLKSLALKL